MMAPDSTPDRPELSAASREALQSALQRYVTESDLQTLQPALKRIAQEAREKQMHPEQLLIVLKDIWFSLPQIAQAAPNDVQTRLLQRVVTICIGEYYSNQ